MIKTIIIEGVEYIAKPHGHCKECAFNSWESCTEIDCLEEHAPGSYCHYAFKRVVNGWLIVRKIMWGLSIAVFALVAFALSRGYAERILR